MDFITTTCFGCGAPLPGEVGGYYCEPCIKAQHADFARERAAFDAYHRFADEILTVTT